MYCLFAIRISLEFRCTGEAIQLEQRSESVYWNDTGAAEFCMVLCNFANAYAVASVFSPSAYGEDFVQLWGAVVSGPKYGFP